MSAAAAAKGEQQCECYAENNCSPDWCGNAANAADGDAGKSRMTQRVRKETHPTCDDHGGGQTKQGRHQKNCQQGIAHKIPLEHFNREDVTDFIPKLHYSVPPFRWKASRKASEFSTSKGVP